MRQYAMQNKRRYSTPDVLYPDLFTDVQLSGVFEDSKTFADAIPKKKPEKIYEAYQALKSRNDFDLRLFIDKYFDTSKQNSNQIIDVGLPIDEHIFKLWKVLKRKSNVEKRGHSLIALPKSFIVPGGRFNEIYYWDSYFTMLGLIVSKKTKMVQNMLDNFAYLIKTIGHIPNGNRTYYLSRSQPPFFSLMVDLYAHASKKYKTSLLRYADALSTEYEYWMDGIENVQIGEANRRVVCLSSGEYLNRYWDDLALPRQESFKEDLSLAEALGRPETILFREIRAACESGWDFSSRWLKYPNDLGSIHTTEIVPIDLNALLAHLEWMLYQVHRHKGNESLAEFFLDKYKKRIGLIHKYGWNENKGYYTDYHFNDKRQLEGVHAASFFPLWLGLADQKRADRCVDFVLRQLKAPGGLLTSTIVSGQQWDAPNGWAPLQWVAFSALKRYEYIEEARVLRSNWLKLNEDVFSRTGKMMEKYNVLDMSLEAGGGEYPVQDGFGWTNGVYMAMRFDLSDHMLAGSNLGVY